ncbi:MAG TPA: hypothetical protein VHP33_10140 [Polyangiaceae bacterium]|nr:hypothetical protein [Polyangiaceae bacterium]
MKKLSKTCLALVLPLSLVWACGSSSEVGNDSSSGAANGSGASASAGALNLGGDGALLGGDGAGASTSTGGTLNGVGGTLQGTGGIVATGTTACSDGKDNDGDDLIDGFDPECTGPADNDEGTFATGIPGDNRDPKWQDCFFDGNSGAGNDKCRYATGCLTGELPADDADCALTDACLKYCAPLTPNGCDCFGCCTVQLPSGDTVDIQTASSCSLDQVGDEDVCPRCVKSDACGNTCGHCELCPGKTVADLPEDCAPTGAGGAGTGTGGTNTGTGGTSGGPGYTCDGGEQVCGPGLPACALTTYCSQGCCLKQPPR